MPLTPSDITSALAYMGWSTSDDMAAKVAAAVNHAGSLEGVLRMIQPLEHSELDRAVMMYAEALRLAADPAAAAETFNFEAGCAEASRDKAIQEAVEFQAKADQRRATGQNSSADEAQDRAHACLRSAAKADALAKSKREAAGRLTMVAA